jgi:hypothetical protein
VFREKKVVVPVDRCQNKGWKADKLERIVWHELEQYLSQPEMVIRQLKIKAQSADQLSALEAKLDQSERQLKAVNREQHQLLHWAMKDFPAEQVDAENKRLNKAKETLHSQKTDLEIQIKRSQNAIIDEAQMKEFIKLLQYRIANDDFEGKRRALEILGITIWLDGQNVEITGKIDSGIVTSPS